MVSSCPLVTIVCGLPVTGKGTIAAAIAAKLGIQHLDIDDNIRRPIFGLFPHQDPYASAETRMASAAEMVESYDLLMQAIDAHLNLGRSVIATATFSKRRSRENLRRVLGKHPEARLRIIWCHAGDETVEVEEIRRRIAARRLEWGQGYFGGCNSVEHYLDDKARYVPLDDLPHLALDTFPPHTVDECVAQALEYIRQG